MCFILPIENKGRNSPPSFFLRALALENLWLYDLTPFFEMYVNPFKNYIEILSSLRWFKTPDNHLLEIQKSRRAPLYLCLRVQNPKFSEHSVPCCYLFLS